MIASRDRVFLDGSYGPSSSNGNMSSSAGIKRKNSSSKIPVFSTKLISNPSVFRGIIAMEFGVDFSK
jgi:hypothetical protein